MRDAAHCDPDHRRRRHTPLVHRCAPRRAAAREHVQGLPQADPRVDVAQEAAVLHLAQVCVQDARVPARVTQGHRAPTDEKVIKTFKAHRNAKHLCHVVYSVRVGSLRSVYEYVACWNYRTHDSHVLHTEGALESSRAELSAHATVRPRLRGTAWPQPPRARTHASGGGQNSAASSEICERHRGEECAHNVMRARSTSQVAPDAAHEAGRRGSVVARLRASRTLPADSESRRTGRPQLRVALSSPRTAHWHGSRRRITSM